LGFVIEIREDPEERLRALTRTWSLAKRLLVVSVTLANQNARRGTFQKCFNQAEIRAYLVAALDEEPIPASSGVLYIFRDKDLGRSRAARGSDLPVYLALMQFERLRLYRHLES
jgi:hypothetical protein